MTLENTQRQEKREGYEPQSHLVKEKSKMQNTRSIKKKRKGYVKGNV